MLPREWNGMTKIAEGNERVYYLNGTEMISVSRLTLIAKKRKVTALHDNYDDVGWALSTTNGTVALPQGKAILMAENDLMVDDVRGLDWHHILGGHKGKALLLPVKAHNQWDKHRRLVQAKQYRTYLNEFADLVV
ncbi:hypothetical protein Barb6_02653 [Bacteroidales bacterium Barb6]|nr:hypothetical protein Barb6_02653 [Bacteroidales bacterium Barb6]